MTEDDPANPMTSGPTTTTVASEGDDVNIPLIVGIVGGAVVILALVIGLIIFLRRRKERGDTSDWKNPRTRDMTSTGKGPVTKSGSGTLPSTAEAVVLATNSTPAETKKQTEEQKKVVLFLDFDTKETQQEKKSKENPPPYTDSAPAIESGVPRHVSVQDSGEFRAPNLNMQQHEPLVVIAPVPSKPKTGTKGKKAPTKSESRQKPVRHTSNAPFTQRFPELTPYARPKIRRSHTNKKKKNTVWSESIGRQQWASML